MYYTRVRMNMYVRMYCTCTYICCINTLRIKKGVTAEVYTHALHLF